MVSDIGMPTHHYWTEKEVFFRSRFGSKVVEIWEDGQWKYHLHRVQATPAPVQEEYNDFPSGWDSEKLGAFFTALNTAECLNE